MKRTILTLFTLIFFFTYSQAQVSNKPKGPKAKNYKPWKDTSKSSSKIMVSQKPLDLKGPKAKNYKPGQDQGRTENLVAASTSNKKRVTGPEAKNAQPWDHREDSTYVATKKKSGADREEPEDSVRE